MSPPAKEEPAEEEQRERTRRGARHLRSSSLASKASGPLGGVSLRHACSSCMRSEAPLPQRLLRPRLLAAEPTWLGAGLALGLGLGFGLGFGLGLGLGLGLGFGLGLGLRPGEGGGA